MSLKYLVISDVHLGHQRTDTNYIIKNLKDYLNDEMLKSIDVLFIAGDFFDRLLSLHNPDVYSIMSFIRVLFERLHTSNTALRVLKGTNSHDWNQCELFTTVYNCIKETHTVDYVYVDHLSIEKYKGYDVLYLPDEWKPTSELIYKDVKALLKSKKLSKVDLIIMHGMFSFQVPSALQSPLIHNEFNYLSICKYYIHPGHIHQHLEFDRILAQGSFDRLVHGEEQSKGGYLCEIGEDVTPSYKFIENVNAKKYITINVNNKTLDDIISRLGKLLTKLPSGSYVRLKSGVDTDAVKYIKKLQIRFVDFNLSLKILNSKVKEKEEDISSLYKPISITKDNISTLLQDIYMKRVDIEKNNLPKLEKLLNEVIDLV